MIYNCNFCQDKDAALMFRAKDYISLKEFAIIKCSNCGLVYTYPQPLLDEIKFFYPNTYYNETKIRYDNLAKLFIRNLSSRRFKKILSNIKSNNGAMLDIGCGRGWQLDYFRERGWQVVGTELSERASFSARKELNLDVRIMDIRECEFNSEYFDVVTLWHVLEHLQEPFQTLEEISRILKRDGLLILEVPNFDSWQAKISRENWFHLDVPRHYYHFSFSTLEEMLKHTGFSILKKENFSLEYEFYGLLQSLLNISGISFNFLWDLLTQKSGKIKQMSDLAFIINIFLTLVFLPIYSFLSIAIGLIAPIFEKGGTITITAHKLKIC